MKAEDSQSTPAPTPTPAPATPQPPAQTYTTTWSSTVMSLARTALQQQPGQHPTASPYYQAYASHYPQAAYAAFQYPPAQSQVQQQTTITPMARPAPTYQTSTYSLNTQTPATTTPTVAAPTMAATTTANNSGMDTADIATLNDALGSAGVDLRAEEESLQRTNDSHQSYRSYEDRTRKQPPKPAFDVAILGATMRSVGTQHKVSRVPDESVNYLALALRARLQDLITSMVAAAKHRTDTQFDRPASLYEEDGQPMWSIVVRRDVAKQLTALERAEREEELRVRKERRERAEMTAAHTAALAAQANGLAAAAAADAGGDEVEGNAKKKRKKDGPGVTARNMSEDVRKKMSNAVATQAAGLGGKYSWMTAANASTPPPKPKPAASTPAPAAANSPASTTAAAATPATTATPATSSWARPYVSSKKTQANSQKDNAAEDDSRTSVTMRDAMFVIEKERGHGGGRGAARGWV